MTTDELLEKLPSHIGRNAVYDKNNVPIAYHYDAKPDICIGWLHLCNEGKEWSAYYGNRGKFLCMKKTMRACCTKRCRQNTMTLLLK